MAGNHVLKVSLITDDSKFKSGMQSAEKQTSGLGLALKGMAAVAVFQLGRRALGAIKDFATDSIRAFSDLNESLNAVEVVFGKNADGIKKLGEEAARSFGLSNAQFNGYAVSLSAFAEQIAGDTGDVVGTMQTLVGRVSDFASVMNLDVSVALEKFQSGLAGQSRPLREFGIDVSDARVQATSLALGIWDGSEAMTESEKIQGRYATIMQQTAKTAGDFANTSDELANKQRILGATLEDTKAQAGEMLAPLKEVWQEIQMSGISTISNFALEFQRLSGKISEAEGFYGFFRNAIMRGEDPIEAHAHSIEKLTDHYVTLTGRIDENSERVQAIRKDTQEYLEILLREGATLEDLTKLREDLLPLLGEESMAYQFLDDALNSLIATEGLAAGSRTRHRDRTKELTEATEEVNEVTKTWIELLNESTEAAKKKAKSMSDLWGETVKLADAEAFYNQQIAEFGPASEEAQAAGLGLLEARANAEAEWATFFTNFPRGFEQAFQHLVDSGMAPETARALADSMQAKFDALPLDVRLRIPQFGFAPDQHGTTYSPSKTGSKVFHEGGVVPGMPGEDILTRLRAGETVLPTHKPDFNLDGGETRTYHINVSSLDPASAAELVVQALQEYERTNGAVPINVRVN